MPQPATAWTHEDEWAGVTSPAERKRRQNRQNQRASRNRKLLRRFAQQDTVELASTQPAASAAPGDTCLARQLPACLDTHQGRRLETRDAAIAFIKSAFFDTHLSLYRPSDLPTLLRLNVINALALNGSVLGIPLAELYRDDMVSFFNLQGPVQPRRAAAIEMEQNSLAPIPVQKAVVHHP